MKGSGTKALGAVAALVAGLWAGAASATSIGVSMAYFDDNWLTNVRNAIDKEAKADGVQVQYEDAQGDIGKQLSQMQNFIGSHVDVMIVNPVDTSATRQMTKLAVDAKIPLVYVSRKPDETTLPPNVVYVGSDETVSGRLQGGEVSRLLDGKGDVVILMGELATNTAVIRTAGVEKVFAAHPGIRVVQKETANFQRVPAIDLVNNLLTAGTHFDAIAANNDEMAIGAIMALQQAGRDPSKVVVAGIDATPDALDEMAKGNLATTVFHNAKGQGKLAVQTALRLAKGEAVDSFNWVPFELVTRENYKEYLRR
jgi:ABC-type sugar transport system substrate-binding protein